jgi:uncharacterized protein (TIGR03435 family)
MAGAPAQEVRAPAVPEFAVASVKASREFGSGAVAFGTSIGHGELKLTGATLRACIRMAYGVKDYQIAGPGWLATEHYDILAKAAGPVPDDELKVMLRGLLAARFKLAFHKETRMLPAYALVPGKNGPKVHAVTADGPARVFANSARGGIAAEGVSMARFADLLAAKVDRPVQDATGLPGVFNIKLEFTADMNATPDGASVFAALQEQLGLKLEARQAPVEMLVIDHVEKVPVEN